MKRLASLLVSVMLVAGLVVQTDAREIDAKEFSLWLEEFRTEALSEGISPTLVERALSNLKPSERILAFDGRQPEFALGFWEYYSRGVSKQRIAMGQKKYSENKFLLENISKKFDVQPRFLMAFWGLESDFGRVKGDHSLVQALATLAFDPRRGDFFRRELLQLLKIIDNGHLELNEAKGSWAGAFGHTQFMPSTFAAYGVDGNQDGRIHLIDSHVDALHSAAKYLSKLGWDDQKTWGREVSLPDNFDYSLAKLKENQSLASWHQHGVRAVSGAALPNVDIEAALIIPSGADGPAFLVYDNFHRIMRWNRSIFFALNVGLLADAIAKLHELQTEKPAGYQALKTQEILTIQKSLNKIGFNTGTPDGVIGRQTRQALRDFQASHNLLQDGYPNSKTRQLLLR